MIVMNQNTPTSHTIAMNQIMEWITVKNHKIFQLTK